MAGIFGELTPVDTATDTAQTPLGGVRGIALANVQGDTIVYAAAGNANQIAALRLTASGQLQPFPAGNSTFAPSTTVVRTLRVVEVDGTDYLVAGRSSGVATFRIESNGSLTPIDDVPDSALVFLDGHRGPIASIEIGGNTYIYVPAQAEDGVSAFRLFADGNLLLVDNVSDASNPLNALSSVYQVHALTVGGNPFLVATAIGESAVSTFSISSTGQLTPVDRIADTVTTPLLVPSMSVSVTLAGFTYIFSAAQNGNAITTLLISPTGNLSFVTSLPGTADWSTPLGLDVFEINGTPFLAMVSEGIDALVLFGINDDGSLTEIDNIDSSTAGDLEIPIFSEFVEIGDRAFVIVSDLFKNFVASYEIGAGPDVLVGTNDADALFGFVNNDTLIGDLGADTLHGGAGNDLLAGGLQADRAFGGDGNDLVVGDGGNDTLEGGDGVDTLLGSAGADSLRGDDGNDLLVGGGGADTAVGGDGEDTLFGGDGVDSLVGGNDNDRLNGGASADTIFGGDGNDHLFGGDGKDVLGGGDGEDTLFGADGSDTLNGGADSDRLVGGQGFDKYRTGSGADVVVVKEGDGRDKILDFQNGADRIDVSDFGLANFNAVNALASTFGAGIIIDFGGGDELIIENFTLAQFNVADVII